MISHARTIMTMVLLAAVAPAISPQTPHAENASTRRDRELPNFDQVNERLYRGGAPNGGGIEKLAKLGIKSIIDLRGESGATNSEMAEAKGRGLRYFRVSLSSWNRPSFSQIEKVLELINDSANWPVFVHCKRGADRTGIVIAGYRMMNEGWTADQARDEAKSHGLHWAQFRMKGFFSDFSRRHRPEIRSPD